MIANGWRPLTSYEHKSVAGHLPNGNMGGGGGSLNERNSGSGPHPVHGKLQEHMSKSEKLSSKQNKHAHDYNPPSILGSFSVFGNSLPKTRGNGGESGKSPVASETREYSFLVPPPREPVRYEIDPYRKVILRDNEAFLRQPSQQYIISHPVGAAPGEIRNVQYFSKGGAAAGSASTHTITTLKNRPVITEYNGGTSGQQSLRPQQQQQQQHVPFESLKLSNTKLFLQPPSANGAPNFAHESQQQPIDNIYERFPSGHLPHPQKLTQESSGNFYTHINHPSPGNYKGQTIERDPSFIVHESHELSYATPAPLQAGQPGFAAFSNFRPSSSYENLHGPERYSTLRPVVSHTEKFIPSKPDNTRQKQENYKKYPQNNGNPNLDNSILSPEYSNGIVNTYYISEQQSLTPPPPAVWSVPSKAKLTSDINEVLPKPDRPAKFNLEPNSNLQESQRPSHQNNLHPNYLFPRPETQQQKQHQPQQQHQYFPNNPLPSINEQPETIYETPESLSLKHFNEQQYRLQQQLLQRDRERLREQQLREQQLQKQQQQIELGRITAAREREKQSTLGTPPSRPIPETPRPTVQYYDTTVIYSQLGVQGENEEIQEIQKLPEQQFIQQEYESNPSKYQQPDVEAPVTYEPENGNVYVEPEKSTTYESTESPTTVGHRTRPRKPTTAVPEQQQQQHRRRKPTTPSYEEPTHRHQEEEYHLSTLAPNPIVQSPGTLFSFPVSSETPTTVYQGSDYPSVTTGESYAPTIVTTPTTTSPPRTSATSSSTTSRPRSRRPLGGNGGNGRRRRPTSTTTEEPETAPPVTYRQEDYTRYEKIESDSPRRKKPSSSVAPTTQPPYEIDPTTSTEQKRFEIQNYGHKLGANENQDYVTELPETYNSNNEHVSSQQSYAYGNERDSAFYYTPAYEEGGQVTTTGQESTDYGSSESAASHSTATNSLNRGKTRENTEKAGEITKNVYTNIPLEELFVNTESPIFYTVTTTTAAPTTTTMTTPTTTRRATSAQPTKSSYARTTGTPVVQTSTETVHTTRAPAHRMRPIRFGNSTRPRFSIKDYKTRLDYRNRKISTSEAPSVSTRQKGSAAAKNQQENSEKESLESTTARYRHMSRVSYRMSSTTPSYQRQRDRDSANSTSTERINRFTPKRRLSNNHLYRSKISTSTTTGQPSAGDEANSDDVSITGTSSTSASTRPNSVRNENVFSSAIRRRPQMKHAVFTQSSDLRTTRKQSTEMVPEETSFYSPAIAQQLLVTDYSTSLKNNEESDNYPNIVTSESHVSPQLPVTTSFPQLSSPPSNLSSLPDENLDDSPPMKLDDTSMFELTTQSSTSPLNEAGQTEALVNESHVTLDAQFEEDLFAKASQSVADLTSSASALYDKPGMFKAVSVSPSASETGSSGSLINGRFKINQDKQPTLPIEAFFHELSSSKN